MNIIIQYIIVAICVVAAIAWIVVKLLRMGKQKKSSCCCGCADAERCQLSKYCHKNSNSER